MSHHSSIRLLLLPRIEHRLDPGAERELEKHLASCTSCKTYFETMSSQLSPSGGTQYGLSVDPYLPTRVRALSARSGRLSARELIVRWSLRTLVFAAAIIVGIYIGERLSYRPAALTDEHIISEYSTYLDGSGIGDRWQTVAQVSEGEAK